MTVAPTNPLSNGLSPTRVEAFTSCPRAFRFAYVDKVPEPTSPAAFTGTVVHRALEVLMQEPAAGRTPEALDLAVERALGELATDPERDRLPAEASWDQIVADARSLARRYLTLEDPRTVEVESTELHVEGRIGDLTVRGIIDRLERDGEGRLVVTDYKTGKAPSQNYEQAKMRQLLVYSRLVREQTGEQPALARLLFVGGARPTELSCTPTDQQVNFVEKRLAALGTTIKKAYDTDTFPTRVGPLCSWCSFQRWCPAFGGDPSRARIEASEALGITPPSLPW